VGGEWTRGIALLRGWGEGEKEEGPRAVSLIPHYQSDEKEKKWEMKGDLGSRKEKKISLVPFSTKERMGKQNRWGEEKKKKGKRGLRPAQNAEGRSGRRRKKKAISAKEEGKKRKKKTNSSPFLLLPAKRKERRGNGQECLTNKREGERKKKVPLARFLNFFLRVGKGWGSAHLAERERRKGGREKRVKAAGLPSANFSREMIVEMRCQWEVKK